MNSTPIGSLSGNAFGQTISRRPEARETGPELDHDADDAKRPSPSPTVNLNGHSVGQLLDVTA